ncbi:MAG: LamG domain-containing protein, partial [Candidatus Roizmanbacteria bacterium]|nr:LamG domain-containing protein [Candidatus Roizmanbacteria bacterium]
MRSYRRLHSRTPPPFPKLIGAFILIIVGVGILMNTHGKKVTIKNAPLAFQKQFVGPYAYTGEIPGVMKTSFGNNKDQGTVAIERGTSKLTFSLPITKSTLVSDGAFLNPSGVQFNSPEKNIEVKYSLLDTGLKEEIILNRIPTENIFPLTLNTENLTIKTTPEGGIVFYNQADEYQFHFERPFVKDGKGNVSYGVQYKLINVQSGKVEELFTKNESSKIYKQLLGASVATTGNKYVLYVEVDPIWLHDTKRTLPITIDPTVVHSTTADFAAGTMNRVTDAGSGATPDLETYYQKTPTDTYAIGLWHMDEVSGNVLDSSGNGNTGTPTGATVAVGTGIIGNGRSVNAGGAGVQTDYIGTGITNTTSLKFSTGFTAEAWIFPTAYDASHNTVVGEENGFLFAFTPAGAVADYIYAGGAFSAAVGGGCTIPLNKWSHKAMTYDGATINSYLNGVLCGSLAKTGTMVSTSLIYIGMRDFAGTKQPFHGTIDEVRISSV